MSAYLDKPIEKHRLLACVASYITPEEVEEAVPEIDQETMPEEEASKQFNLIEESVLQQLINDTSLEVLPELIAIFEQDVKERVTSMEEFSGLIGTPSADQEVERHLHTLSSSCAIYGLQKMHTDGRALEALCRQDMFAVKAQLVDFIRLSYDSVSALKDLAEDKIALSTG